MKTRLNLPAMILLTILVAVVGFQSYALHTAAKPLPPAVIATVDLERLYEGLLLRGKLDEERKAMADRLDADRVALREEIEEMKASLEDFAPGTVAFEEEQAAIEQATLDLEALVKFTKAKIELDKADATREIYQNIKNATAWFAKQQGYDYVILNDSLVELRDGTELQMLQQISARRFIYANEALDITDEIIGWMNAQPNLKRP